MMEEYHKRGVLKAIGVSNYEVRHLEEVISHSETVPHVNQIEIHPHFQNRWETYRESLKNASQVVRIMGEKIAFSCLQ